MANHYITPTPVIGVAVFIATPTFHAPFTAYTWSLARTTAELTRRGIPFQIGIPDDVKNVDDGRNDLVREFRAGNCTDILFIDSDEKWEPNDVIRILGWNEDVVCGAYPFKSDGGGYPIGRILNADEATGLLEVSYAPTGFMRIRRKVFDILEAGLPKSGGTPFFFMRKFNQNTYDGGDVNFCRRWIAAGGKVKVDPDLRIEHVGFKRWGGRFSDYLAKPENLAKHTAPDRDKNQTVTGAAVTGANADGAAEGANNGSADYPGTPLGSPATVSAAVRRLANLEGANFDDFVALANTYGNRPWAATPEFLHAMWLMAMNLPSDAVILECGSGLSTLILAATGRRVVAMEEHQEWAVKTDALLRESGLDAEIKVARMNGEWYNAKAAVANLGASMVVIDGPRRRKGISRTWPIMGGVELGIVRPDAAVIMDDVGEVSGGGEWVCTSMGAHPFAVGRLHQGMVTKDNVAETGDGALDIR